MVRLRPSQPTAHRPAGGGTSSIRLCQRAVMPDAVGGMFDEIGEHLRAWAFPSPPEVSGEIHHSGRAGRAFTINAGAGRYVAKVVFDRPPYVLAGLSVSQRVASHGIATGPPVPTVDGELAIP